MSLLLCWSFAIPSILGKTAFLVKVERQRGYDGLRAHQPLVMERAHGNEVELAGLCGDGVCRLPWGERFLVFWKISHVKRIFQVFSDYFTVHVQ